MKILDIDDLELLFAQFLIEKEWDYSEDISLFIEWLKEMEKKEAKAQ
jgi:hypothetical protein